MKRCTVQGCTRQRAKGRRLCSCCQKRQWRERNPIRAAFGNLRSNARRRGKEFTLTFEQFEKFCIATDYIKKKGRHATCYHIDRIDENGGYTPDNIQLLTNAENVRKYVSFTYDYDPNKGEMVFDTRVSRKGEGSGLEDVPF